MPAARALVSHFVEGTPPSGTGKEMNSIPVMAKIGPALKAEFFDLVALKEAHDDVDSLPSPTGDLVVQPTARARARRDRQASASGQVNPKNLVIIAFEKYAS